MAHHNTTFIGGSPTWANACVGENGSPDYRDYAMGFSQAAGILMDAAIRGKGTEYSVDELVYPVCFNMRHSVELRLKGAISELIILEKCRGRELQFDMMGSHDITKIWSFFVDKTRTVDDRYAPLLARINKKINDIAEVDPTGQTFRYPEDTESQKHLVDVAIINFFALKSSFSELEAALDELHYLNKYLRDEYKMGTYTKQLSRKNLFELAALLPPRSEWTEESFSDKKNFIKERFKIGSRELSESIKLIEGHFEIAPQIEMSIPLYGVEEVDIDEFFSHWFKQHDLPSDSDPIDSEVSEWGSVAMVDSILKHREIREEIWTAVRPELTPEKLAGMSALYYFAKDLDFSELYTRTYKNFLLKAQTAFEDSEKSIWSNYFQVSGKTNAVNNILISLYFLKKSETAERLLSKYALDKKFSWLDKARSGYLFRKPQYSGYEAY